MNQTLRLTTLGDLEAGGRVNLELAAAAPASRSAATSSRATSTASARSIAVERGRVRPPRCGSQPRADLRRYVGRARLDRRSTASASPSPRSTTSGLEVSLIPETLERTTLGELRRGRPVNVEVDVVARYVGAAWCTAFARKEQA